MKCWQSNEGRMNQVPITCQACTCCVTVAIPNVPITKDFSTYMYNLQTHPRYPNLGSRVNRNIQRKICHSSTAISRVTLWIRSSWNVVGSARRHCVISPDWAASSDTLWVLTAYAWTTKRWACRRKNQDVDTNDITESHQSTVNCFWISGLWFEYLGEGFI